MAWDLPIRPLWLICRWCRRRSLEAPTPAHPLVRVRRSVYPAQTLGPAALLFFSEPILWRLARRRRSPQTAPPLRPQAPPGELRVATVVQAAGAVEEPRELLPPVELEEVAATGALEP